MRGQDKIQQHGTVSPMTRSLGIEAVRAGQEGAPLKAPLVKAQRDVLMQRALCSHTAKHNNVGKDNVQIKKNMLPHNLSLAAL